MLACILRNGHKFTNWGRYGVSLHGVGWIEVYPTTGKVYLCVCLSGSVELYGLQAALVRGIMTLGG